MESLSTRNLSRVILEALEHQEILKELLLRSSANVQELPRPSPLAPRDPLQVRVLERLP
jgi:hypothetical protein